MFTASAAKFTARPCLGARTGPGGAYAWLTYGEVDELAGAVASAMAGRGVGARARAGVYGANAPEWMVAMQACNRSAVYCVPLYGASFFVVRAALGWAALCAHSNKKYLIDLLRARPSTFLISDAPSPHPRRRLARRERDRVHPRARGDVHRLHAGREGARARQGAQATGGRQVRQDRGRLGHGRRGRARGARRRRRRGRHLGGLPGRGARRARRADAARACGPLHDHVHERDDRRPEGARAWVGEFFVVSGGCLWLVLACPPILFMARAGLHPCL